MRVGGQHPGQPGPAALRGGADRHHRRRSLGPRIDRPDCADAERAEPAHRAGGRAGADALGRSGDPRDAHRRGGRRTRRRRRGLPGAARRPTARTAPSRACWRLAGDPLRRSGCVRERGRRWTRSSPRSSWPPTVCRSAVRWCCGPARDVDRRRQRDGLGLPVFVKPARAGSSFGITRVDGWADLDAAIAAAREHDPKVLVEAAVVGREIECGVLEVSRRTGRGRVARRDPDDARADRGRRSTTSTPSTSTTSSSSTSPPSCPTATSPSGSGQSRCGPSTALDCAGLARVDFFVTADGTSVINEINTMPGFTPISMYPRMWAASRGRRTRPLISTLIDTALARGTGLR